MATMEFDFHKITIADKAWMDARFAEDTESACEYTFANNFIWRNVYDVEVTETDGCALIRFWSDGEMRYSYPIGAGEKKAVIEKLLFLCHKNGQKLVMAPLSEADKAQLFEWFPGQFLIWGDRDDYDYIYAREKLATLSGKKLHGKRNHIARFMDDEDWSYEEMTAENLEECREMTYSWMRMREEKWNEEMEQEVMVLHEAFDHFKELGLIGGVLRKKKEIVAFTMGEPVNEEIFVVHFEKAYPSMQGAYPMINQQFVINACEKYRYVNREEDTGDLGLRKAKLSYYPEILLKKYCAKESLVVFASAERDREQIVELWQTCFGDDRAYIDFFLEHRMTDETMLVLYEDKKIVSMASFLPMEYQQETEYKKARYVYAVATLPQYRRRGYAATIIETAKSLFKEPLILEPAQPELVDYYEGLGFCEAFLGREDNLRMMELTENAKQPTADWEAVEEVVCLKAVTAEEYQKIRDKNFGQTGYVRWDVPAIQYAIRENAYCGGETYAVMAGENDASEDILMYRKNKEVLEILETTLKEQALEALLPKLLKKTETVQAVRSRHVGMLWTSEHVLAEVLRQGYLNLTLA